MVAKQFGLKSEAIQTAPDLIRGLIALRDSKSKSPSIFYLNLNTVIKLMLHLRRDITHNIKLFGCYMVKPHGQLVPVSYTHYCASTPGLSTS